MKVSLVVASGSHQGKVIPIAGQEFTIGRDPQCNLRPASQAISKRHCGVIVREGKTFIVDFGSTNGTLVNDELIKDGEIEVTSGATIKIGPLDFILRVDVASAEQGTPFPPTKPDAAASALAAVKATVAASPKPTQRDSTPNPAALKKPADSGSKESPALTGSKEAPALKASATPKPAPKVEPPTKLAAKPATSGSEDDIAAMLLGMDDDEGGSSGGGVPDGSTVMEMPAQNAADTMQGDKPSTAKPDEKKKATSREDMTNAASEILRKMMRRPK